MASQRAAVCAQCFQSLTSTERVAFDGGFYHRRCFVCSVCGRELCDLPPHTPATTDASGRRFFCPQHSPVAPNPPQPTTPPPPQQPSLSQQSEQLFLSQQQTLSSQQQCSEEEVAQARTLAYTLEAQGCTCMRVGFLTKQGAFVHSWRRRLCALVRAGSGSRELRYYHPKKLDVPRGAIDLATVADFSGVRIPLGGAKKGASTTVGFPGFSLLTPTRRWLFVCESERERDGWITALHGALGGFAPLFLSLLVKSHLHPPRSSLFCSVNIINEAKR